MPDYRDCICTDLARCLSGEECREKNCPSCVPAHERLRDAVKAWAGES